MTDLIVRPFVETPIFDAVRTQHGWDPTAQQTPPSLHAEAVEVLRDHLQDPVPTPLMDDVERHGISPWDEARRVLLVGHLEPYREQPKPQQRSPRKPRGRKAAR